jgi:hypothetical protein
MQFIRLGGLSPVKHKREKFTSNFHKPPTRKGIYAFISPYIETYLCMFNETHEKEFKTHGFRKFEYEGPIWCHLSENTTIGSWLLTNTDELPTLLKKCKHHDIKKLMEDPIFGGVQKHINICDDPYKRGRNGFMSRDHLEVFIEGKYLGRIK